MTSPLAVDTSVAVPLLTATHEAHAVVLEWASGRPLDLCGHALAETYSVLTRLPGSSRVSPDDAVRLIDSNFEMRLPLPEAVATQAHHVFARVGIEGGAIYDGLVALAALGPGQRSRPGMRAPGAPTRDSASPSSWSDLTRAMLDAFEGSDDLGSAPARLDLDVLLAREYPQLLAGLTHPPTPLIGTARVGRRRRERCGRVGAIRERG